MQPTFSTNSYHLLDLMRKNGKLSEEFSIDITYTSSPTGNNFPTDFRGNARVQVDMAKFALGLECLR